MEKDDSELEKLQKTEPMKNQDDFKRWKNDSELEKLQKIEPMKKQDNFKLEK